MITEDYVSFEIAKLLKEKGFDERVKSYYTESGLEGYMFTLKTTKNTELNNEFISRPTHQMAMKWLREEKEIYITIIYGDYPSLNKVFWTLQIDSLEGFDLPDSFYKEYDKYEEACEAAIKYCLENLL